MPSQTPPKPSDAEAARYVAEMCSELRSLIAGRPPLRTARYLLDVARLEAEKVAKDAPAR